MKRLSWFEAAILGLLAIGGGGLAEWPKWSDLAATWRAERKAHENVFNTVELAAPCPCPNACTVGTHIGFMSSPKFVVHPGALIDIDSIRAACQATTDEQLRIATARPLGRVVVDIAAWPVPCRKHTVVRIDGGDPRVRWYPKGCEDRQ